MKINRRELITLGAMGAAALAVDVPAEAKDKLPKSQLKVSSQEGIVPGKDLPEKLAKMEKWGIDGIEFSGRGLADRIPDIKAALANSKLKPSAICAGFEGALASDDESVRAKCRNSMKAILVSAGEIGSTGLIFVPAFNGQTKLDHVEARKVLLDQLPELAEFAVQHGTRLLLEPLNRKETWLVRLVADAASISRDTNHPGACVMGDFYHMYIEETSDMGAFISAGAMLHHVHLASIKRKLPGQDERDYTNGFKGLKMIGYQDFCSFECGVIGDRDVEIPKSVKFLRDQWSKA
ncbi:MAG TPA: sugar phosphate isomerase/epimerase family protein [Armatimonadota bacterium]|nr:sugar phosphate isomerase/epimerase family protein [Armatimonadota bacterium]